MRFAKEAAGLHPRTLGSATSDEDDQAVLERGSQVRGIRDKRKTAPCGGIHRGRRQGSGEQVSSGATRVPQAGVGTWAGQPYQEANGFLL